MKGIRVGRVFRGKVNLRVTLVLLLLLLTVMCAWLFIRAQRLESNSSDVIEIYMGDMLAGRVDSSWMMRLETVELDFRGGTFEGVSLSRLLESMGARPTSQESIHFQNDTQELTVLAETVLSPESAYLFYQLDGKPITQKQGGAYQLLVFTPDGGFSSLGGVTSITVDLIE